MNTTTARKIARTHFVPALTGVTLPKAARKELNPALFALALPTLGQAHTLREYLRALTPDQLVALDVVLNPARKGVTAKPVAKAAPAKRPVPEFIVRRAINRAAKQAAKVA
jgi:hypothetical protein